MMIISVVIMALIQAYSNNLHIFNSIKNQIKSNQYASSLISNEDYGFEDKHISLYDLFREFDLESDLKMALKERKAEVLYKERESIDLGEAGAESQDAPRQTVVLEIGSSVIKTEEFSTSLLRLRIK